MKNPIYTGIFQSDLDAAGYRLIGLPAPSASSDAATKDYVDAQNAGVLPAGWVSVMDYGAVADGVTDNTAAVQAAIAAATTVVYFPAGNYFFTGSIGAIPVNKSLVGAPYFGPIASKQDTSGAYDHSHMLSPLDGGTTFLVTANAGNATGPPFIEISDNCAVIGIAFYWPNQIASGSVPTAYPWAIHMNGSTAGTVKYCNFVNAYQGIYIENTIFSLVEEVRGQMLYRGIKCEGNYDVTRLRGVHFNATWSLEGLGRYQLANSIAFDFGRNDLLLMTDCFAFWYGTWAHFYTDFPHSFHSPNAFWGIITGGGGDSCTKPIWVEQVQDLGVDFNGIHITNNNNAGPPLNPDVVIASSNTGSVRFHSSIMLGWDGRFGTVAGTGNVMLDDCYFFGSSQVDGVTPAVFATTGWAVTGAGNFALRDCTFRTTQTHVNLGASLTKAVVTGNLCSDTFNVTNGMTAGSAVIDNNTGGGTRYIGSDARLVAITGGLKLQVRNASTGVWIDGDSWTNP